MLNGGRGGNFSKKMFFFFRHPVDLQMIGLCSQTVFFFLYPLFLESCAVAVVPGLATTFLGSNYTDCILLRKNPKRFQIKHQFIPAILSVIVQLMASFHSLSHTKFAWEAVSEAFCLNGQTIYCK